MCHSIKIKLKSNASQKNKSIKMSWFVAQPNRSANAFNVSTARRIEISPEEAEIHQSYREIANALRNLYSTSTNQFTTLNSLEESDIRRVFSNDRSHEQNIGEANVYEGYFFLRNFFVFITSLTHITE